ncbi:MAG: STAS/SEC14 domain-containing protein [Candidatus Aminicenantes bacterium]|nr:STAS/SEC14 domain-containing protein [Candidatus Aminicenantes bacterium]
MNRKNTGREVWIGESRMFLGLDDILYCTFVGNVDEECLKKFAETAYDFAGKVKGKLKVIADLDRAGMPTAAARKAAKKYYEDERIGEIALYGMKSVARVVATFVMGFSKKQDLRFFKSREEALAWLQHKDEGEVVK